jgi:arabinogalactan oligomer / maltooligosaccharide transport system permease protein
VARVAQLAIKAPKKAEQIADRRPVAASSLFMGLGQILFQKQYIKGAFFSLAELVVLINCTAFYSKIRGFITLGDARPELPIMQRDNSLFMMVEGIIYIILLIAFIGLYIVNIRDAANTQRKYQRTGSYPTTRHFLSSLADTSFAVVGLSPILVMIVFFILIPLLFSALIAFTNYSSPKNIPPANTVDWVGLNTFKEIANRPLWSGAFARTVIWTFMWAALATATSYAGGMLMALTLLNRKLKLPKLFRSIYVLPYSVPAMLSLMVWRNLLNGQFGPVNGLLKQWGIIAQDIPWLSEIGLARFSCVLVNLWLGFPYFMMLITGVMTSVPGDLYEAAQIDGASKRQQFLKITLPLVLYQTIPLFIMSFSYNLNNFGAVYYLTQGGPTDTATTQSGAGGTDILMSWMYKLTYDLRQYNKAAVLAVLLFIVIAPFAIYNFSRTKAFKDGEL